MESMKLLGIFLAVLALTAFAWAGRPTNETFQKLRADSETLSALLQKGGVTDTGEACTFAASMADYLGVPHLVLRVQSGAFNGGYPLVYAMGSDMTDEYLKWEETSHTNASSTRVYRAEGQLWMSVLIGATGALRSVELYSSQEKFQCMSITK